jgi:hypothetical protein
MAMPGVASANAPSLQDLYINQKQESEVFKQGSLRVRDPIARALLRDMAAEADRNAKVLANDIVMTGDPLPIKISQRGFKAPSHSYGLDVLTDSFTKTRQDIVDFKGASESTDNRKIQRDLHRMSVDKQNDAVLLGKMIDLRV